MSENQTPIYDQTVTAQGFDPIRSGLIPAAGKIDGALISVTLTEEQATLVRGGSIKGYSIRKGGNR